MRKVFDSISRGLLLISIGVVFFLLNYGILSWGFWLYVVDLWPLILILAGLGLLLNRRIPFSTVLLVFLLSIVGYSMIMGNKPLPQNWKIPFSNEVTETKTINVALPADVKKAKVNLKLGGAQVQIQGLESGDSNGQLMTGNYQGIRQSSTQRSDGSGLTTQQSGDTLNISLSSASFGFNVGNNNRSSLSMNLSPKVNYDLTINAGAINGVIDLSQLAVDNLTVDTGASNFDLRMGDRGVTTQGTIDSGASKLTLSVPDNVGLKIRLNGVATNTNFMGSGLFSEDKNWVSSNYATAKTKINLEISVAAGSVQLERTKSNLQ